MRNMFVISDTHFGHDNIIKFCNRPFQNSQEMDEVLIKNWNEVVGVDDLVYHLGDVYFGKTCTALERLNGRKILILGNHDNGKDPYLHQHFEEIQESVKIRHYGLLLTHRPTDFDSELGFGIERNLHGHIHELLTKNQRTTSPSRHINVSVEHIDYRPQKLETFKWTHAKSKPTRELWNK